MSEVEQRDVIVQRERSPWGVVGAVIAVLVILFILYLLFSWWSGNGTGTNAAPSVSPSLTISPSTVPSSGL